MIKCRVLCKRNDCIYNTNKANDISGFSGYCKQSIINIGKNGICKSYKSSRKYFCHVCGVLEGEKHKPFCSVGNGIYYHY